MQWIISEKEGSTVNTENFVKDVYKYILKEAVITYEKTIPFQRQI